MNKFQSDWRGSKCFYCKKRFIGTKHKCLCDTCLEKLQKEGVEGKRVIHPLWNIEVYISVPPIGIQY